MITHTIQHDDGSVEIVRVIDEDVLSEWIAWNPLAYEASIVWLDDVQALDFVRAQFIDYCTHRRNKLIPESKGRILGYSRLTVDARKNPNTGYFTRRVFYLWNDEDGRVKRGEAPPIGTVAPRSLLPSKFGELLGTEQETAITPKIEQWEGEKDESWIRSRQLPLGTLGVLIPVDGDGRHIALLDKEVIVGRSEACNVTLPHSTVSKEHCRLTFDAKDNVWYLVDLDSTGGTFVNGQRLSPDARLMLTRSDVLSLATYEYKIDF